jgi:2-polyprenyl-3-methyl-5-hydroxy-6-metoxy-1,4-benzoquinol methylase
MAAPSFLQRLVARLAGSPAAPAPRPPGHHWDPATPEERRESARWAYRTILLREPDSASAIEHLARSPDSRAMRDALLRSAEARAQPGFPVMHAMTGDEPAQAVQVDVTPEERRELFARVQTVWQALGESKPHWSVVTADEFRPENIDRAMEAFYASGEANVATVMRTLERNGIDHGKLRTCLDFGCGVGRLSLALAGRFPEVLGVDVSESHLALARDAAARRGARNVSFRRLDAVDALEALPRSDFVLSLIVLQHNPPPVIRALLGGLLGRVAPGGVAMIQVPTYLPAGYRFDADAREYLASGGREMEMHAIPQAECVAAAREAGLDVLEVLDDHWTGFGPGSRSNTFVLRRP